MERYQRHQQDKERIRKQTDAEFAFAQSLEAQGVPPAQFMAEWRLSLHQFNILAHYVYGVNDEELALPPTLKALLFAVQSTTERQAAVA